MKEKSYILGTDPEELYRLGVQHYAWAEQTQAGWRRAGLAPGHHVLELGSGPGFCTRELAYNVGAAGQVFAVDQSENYLNHIRTQLNNPQLNIQTLHTRFEDLHTTSLPAFDLLYSRWALAWTDAYEQVLEQCIQRMNTHAKLLFHEYFRLEEHCVDASYPALNFAIQQCLQSFHDAPGQINLAALLPTFLHKQGLQVEIRPLKRLVTPRSKAWNWPISYYETYIPRLVHSGYLSQQQAHDALHEVADMKQNPNAYVICPLVAEVIAYR